ncbi:short-chain dehydrogenase/reductase [Zhongshania arctica]|uniref:Short-chain dehydrogenase/reductase n=1 Tax=Zhongshania arctica TaxID=3238302 RepID=A0ABV3TUM8_9GAMM
MYRLQNKTVFITGAARGLGASIARRLHQLGANVALIGLELEYMEATCADLGSCCIAIEADVTDAQSLVNAAEEVKRRLGPIDIAVMNAGILHIGNFDCADSAGFDRTLTVNLHGVINSIRAVLPQIVSQRGYILNVASVAAVINGPLVGAYAVAKAGVDALSNSLRIELARKGVSVGCAYFGAIDTDLVHGSRQHPAMAKMEASLPNFLGAEISVHKAVAVIENAITKRSSRVWAPNWISLIYAFRGVLQPIVEWRYSGGKDLAEALDIADSEEQKGDRHQNFKLGEAVNILVDKA